MVILTKAGLPTGYRSQLTLVKPGVKFSRGWGEDYFQVKNNPELGPQHPIILKKAHWTYMLEKYLEERRITVSAVIVSVRDIDENVASLMARFGHPTGHLWKQPGPDWNNGKAEWTLGKLFITCTRWQIPLVALPFPEWAECPEETYDKLRVVFPEELAELGGDKFCQIVEQYYQPQHVRNRTPTK